MTRLRAGLARIRSAVTAPARGARRWWDDFDSPQGQVATAGLLLLSGGLVFVWPPLALIVPGALLVAMSLGFRLDRPRGGD